MTLIALLLLSVVFVTLIVVSNAGIAKNRHTQAKIKKYENTALVTLVTGSNSGYEYGAVALGESLRMVGSKLKRIVLVTPDVTAQGRSLLELAWEVREVEPIACNQQFHPSVSQHSTTGDGMKSDLARWNSACTKFQVWQMIEFERILFMDSDMVVTEPIDDAMWDFSNASLAAAPEVFPPDTFNSGFMLLTPSVATYQHLLKMNREFGSLEGGDQGVLVNYLCPTWYAVGPTDPDCGRLPWFFNVEAQYYSLYKTYRTGYGLGNMRVIHFINDGKPWKTLMYDLNPEHYGPVSQRPSMIQALSEDNYVESHMYWRYCFLRATGEKSPATSIYYKKWSDVTNRKGVFGRGSLPLFDEDPAHKHRISALTGVYIPGPEDYKFLVGAETYNPRAISATATATVGSHNSKKKKHQHHTSSSSTVNKDSKSKSKNKSKSEMSKKSNKKSDNKNAKMKPKHKTETKITKTKNKKKKETTKG